MRPFLQAVLLVTFLLIDPSAQASLETRIDTIKNPGLRMGAAYVGFKADGQYNTDLICSYLGYQKAHAPLAWIWKHGKHPFDYLITPTQADDHYSTPNEKETYWSRVQCQGPTAVKTYSDKYEVKTISHPKITLSALATYFRADRHSGDEVCRHLGFDGAQNEESWISEMAPKDYREQIGYVYSIKTGGLVARNALQPVWTLIHCRVPLPVLPSWSGYLNLLNIERFIDALTPQLYPERQNFLRNIRDTLLREAPTPMIAQPEIRHARIFALLALDPFMDSLESAWFKKEIQGIWDRDLREIQGENQFPQIRSIPISTTVARVALGLLQSGLVAAQSESGTEASQARIKALQTHLGLVAAHIENRERMRALIDDLQSDAQLLGQMQTSARISGIGLSFSAVIEYLNAKYPSTERP